MLEPYPERAVIEKYINRARFERSLEVRRCLVGLAQALTRPFRMLAERRTGGLVSERSGAEQSGAAR